MSLNICPLYAGCFIERKEILLKSGICTIDCGNWIVVLWDYPEKRKKMETHAFAIKEVGSKRIIPRALHQAI